MKEYLRWGIFNFLLLACLLSGIEGFVTLSLILYTLTALIGIILMSDDICREVIEKEIKQHGKVLDMVPAYIDMTYDVVVALILAYLGYPYIAALYVIHIMGSHTLRQTKEKIKAEKCQTI